MKVTCQACSAQYTIADDKVKGRKVKIRCKACQTPIVVDGQNPPPETANGTSEAPPSLDPFAPETAVPADADVWNVNLSDADSRTMTTAEVIEAFRSGVVTSDAYVWRDGMADWVPILDCVELAPLLSGPTETPAPVAGQTPLAPGVVSPETASKPAIPNLAPGAAASGGAVRAASSKAQSGADLFGDIHVAGSESDDIDVATSARGLPVLPGSTGYDDKPTGQRNENSVLFSLDAMKAGFGAPAPAQKSKPAVKGAAPRSTQPSNPDDPFGMGAAGGIAGLGAGGSPLFSLNDNQALLTAPPPPEPKPIAAAAADYGPRPAPAASGAPKLKKLALFGGVGVAALVAAFLFFSGNDKEQPTREERAASAAYATPDPKRDAADAKPEPERSAAKADKKDEVTEPAAPAPSAAVEEKKEDAKAEPTKAVGKPGAPAKKEEPAEAAPSNAPPFSKASAISALTSSAAAAGACKKPGGPTGSGKVQVTFAPSGRVTTATVMGGPFAGTAVGGCVAGAFRRAKVPAFSGNPVTVSKSFAIN